MEVRGIELTNGWYEHGIKEAFYIKALDPSSNRHMGARHQLSSIWNQNDTKLVT